MDDETKRQIGELSSRGLGHEAAGQHELALAAFQASTRIAPTYADHYNAANMLLALKRPAEALVEYDRSIACASDYAEAWCNRGIALSRLGQLDDACASFERALGINAQLANARRCLALASLDRANKLKLDRGANDGIVDARPGGVEDQIVVVIDRALALGIDDPQLVRWAWAEKLIRLQRIAHSAGRMRAQYRDNAEHAAALFSDDPRFAQWVEDARAMSA